VAAAVELPADVDAAVEVGPLVLAPEPPLLEQPARTTAAPQSQRRGVTNMRFWSIDRPPHCGSKTGEAPG